MEAWRFGNLVYIVITKHASTSFRSLFRDRLGWTETTHEAIVWNRDKAFAHIMDPVARHAKGTVEYIAQNNMWDILNDPKFETLLATACFDIHSYPISAQISQLDCYRVDWIMMDHPSISCNELTNKFLASHGINIGLDQFPQLNTTAGKVESNKIAREKALEKVQELQRARNVKENLKYIYHKDIQLYDKIKSRTQWAQSDWKHVSWLNNE